MELQVTTSQDTVALQLSPITIKEEYRKKWNITSNDFFCLTKNGNLISDSLYRCGAFEGKIKENYFMLLKHVESFYSKEILRMSKSTDPKHLESRWVIIDKNGVEKVEFSQFKSPYLVKDSCIYSIESKYYNIETGEYYGYASTSIQSKEFLFLDNSFTYSGEDKSKMGVMKINKKDGSWELFS